MSISKKLRIAVLLGGISSERDISIKSGQGVAQALRSSGFDVYEILVNDRKLKGLTKENFDVAFIALHGFWGEDGGVQKLLEGRGIHYTGSGQRASMLAMDKLKSRKIFKKCGLNVPRYRVIKRGAHSEEIRKASEELGLPLVIKPVCEGSSIGVDIIFEGKNVDDMIKRLLNEYGRCLMEEYIKGREMTVGILRGKALPIIEIRPKRNFFNFAAKYNGSTREIPNPSLEKKIEKEIKDAALKAHESLGCRGFSRVDLILREDNVPFVLEVNTIPGFTEVSLLPRAARAAGLTFGQLCRSIIQSAFNGR